MEKALLLLFTVSALCPCEAQTSWGTIRFSNRNIPTPTGDAAYNVPIWAQGSTTVGAGTMPGGATVALFRAIDLPNGAPIASVRLRSDTPANAAFFSEFPIVEVPGVVAGDTTTLVIRAWAGPSFSDTHFSSEWTLTTKPLGGIRPLDGVEIPTPGLTGWGFGDGALAGVSLGPLSVWPWPRITAPVDQSALAASEQITIRSEVVMESNMGTVVLTNLTLLANDTVLRSQNGSSPSLTASVNSLVPGTYALRLASSGYFQTESRTSPYGPHTSAPVNITIVAPMQILLGSPQTSDGEATFGFSYTVNPGLRYVIKNSGDLVNWESVATNIPSVNPAYFSELLDSAAKRFYKVERLPNP